MPLKTDYVTATINTTNLWADSVNGNDSYNGLSAATAKKTLAALEPLIPKFIQHETWINLRGSFNESLNVSTSIDYNTKLIVDGGASEIQVLAGPYVDNVTTDKFHIGLTTVGWTADQHRGYHVRITSGPSTGQSRLIRGNTATSLEVHKQFTSIPTGSTFEIVRPKTMIGATGASSKRINFYVQGSGTAYCQNLFFNGTTNIGITIGNSQTTISLSHIIITSTSYSNSALWAYNSLAIYTSENTQLPGGSSDFIRQAGVSSNKGSIRTSSTVDVFLEACVVYYILIAKGSVSINSGTRCTGISLSECIHGGWDEFRNFSPEYSPLKCGGNTAYSGMYIVNCIGLLIDSGIIENNTIHGIELENSSIIINEYDGDLQGSGNGGAGIYAHGNSTVFTRVGHPLNITGTVGDLAISSPTVQEATWAAIDAGTIVFVNSEATLVKAR